MEDGTNSCKVIRASGGRVDGLYAYSWQFDESRVMLVRKCSHPINDRSIFRGQLLTPPQRASPPAKRPQSSASRLPTAAPTGRSRTPSSAGSPSAGASAPSAPSSTPTPPGRRRTTKSPSAAPSRPATGSSSAPWTARATSSSATPGWGQCSSSAVYRSLRGTAIPSGCTPSTPRRWA
jgi:hypothetical protein